MAGRKSERSSASLTHERSVSTLCKEVSTKRARAGRRRFGVAIAVAKSKSVIFRGCSRWMPVTYLHLHQALNQRLAISLSAKYCQRVNFNKIPMIILLHQRLEFSVHFTLLSIVVCTQVGGPDNEADALEPSTWSK